ncbi:MAG TPA: histidine kinase, partial [Desulfovibrio sp.]|nr:histidine kinase [Desulfovibrio sp.]
EVVVARAFAEDTATLVEAKATERGVRFLRDFAEAGMATGGDGGGADLGTFEADAGALSSALVNLLENAVEACAADGRKQDHVVTFRVRGTSDEVTFTIIDNGTGMDRETREKLFTLFFSSKGTAGTGIGLFVASQVVRQHGGHIAVASERGEGSTFTVSLPRRLPDAVRRGEAAGEEGHASDA